VGITLQGTRAAFNKLSVFIAMLVVSKTRRAVSSAIARQTSAGLSIQARLGCKRVTHHMDNPKGFSSSKIVGAPGLFTDEPEAKVL
jgi:hypothetical protein